MSAQTGYVSTVGNLVTRGKPTSIIEKNVETADVYPGLLVKEGTTAFDVQVGDGVSVVKGWAGYEHTSPRFKKDSIDTIYAVSDKIKVLSGGNFDLRAKLAPGFQAYDGDLLIPWSGGHVAPAVIVNGKLCVRIPFTNSATVETDTSVNLVAGMIIDDCYIHVTTAVASSSIDVGLLSTESGGDADGFVDGLATTATGIKRPGPTVTTGSNEVYYSASTRGVLLVDTFTAGSDVATDVGTYAEKVHQVSTAVSVTYTTSNHAIAGFIYLAIGGVGVEVVGDAKEGKSASSSAQNINVHSRK